MYFLKVFGFTLTRFISSSQYKQSSFNLVFLDEFQLQKKDLAKEIGVSAVAITKYTKGLTLPSFEVLISIANYFNVSADYLIGLVNEPVSERDYVYFAPIGKLNYSFKISDSETLEG